MKVSYYISYYIGMCIVFRNSNHISYYRNKKNNISMCITFVYIRVTNAEYKIIQDNIKKLI